MFNYRRRAKSACPNLQSGSARDAQSTTYEFVATFDATAAGNPDGGDDSGIYTMRPEDRFAVLRCAQAGDANKSATHEKAQALAVAHRVPKVIAVMLEPDGQSRFFHPEESRRAKRPVWRPLQRVES